MALSTLHYLAKYSPTPDVDGGRHSLIEHEDMIKTHLLISAGAYIVTAFAATGAVLSRV